MTSTKKIVEARNIFVVKVEELTGLESLEATKGFYADKATALASPLWAARRFSRAYAENGNKVPVTA